MRPLWAHVIDFWLEPMMREDGINLYERAGNIALDNVSKDVPKADVDFAGLLMEVACHPTTIADRTLPNLL